MRHIEHTFHAMLAIVRLGMRPRVALGFCAIVICFSAINLTAQTLSISPPTPTSLTPVTISVTSSCPSLDMNGTVQSGFVFDIPANYNCILVPEQTYNYDAGLLAPGTYTVRLVDVDNPGSIQVLGTFAVAAAPIPALDVPGLVGLTSALMLIAFVVLRRANGA